MIDRDPNEMIWIHHPETDGLTNATYEAFKTVWEPRGWQEADALAVRAGGILGKKVTDIDKLTVPELLAVAAETGAEADATDKKDAILRSIRQAATPLTLPAPQEMEAATTPEAPKRGGRRKEA